MEPSDTGSFHILPCRRAYKNDMPKAILQKGASLPSHCSNRCACLFSASFIASRKTVTSSRATFTPLWTRPIGSCENKITMLDTIYKKIGSYTITKLKKKHIKKLILADNNLIIYIYNLISICCLNFSEFYILAKRQ